MKKLEDLSDAEKLSLLKEIENETESYCNDDCDTDFDSGYASGYDSALGTIDSIIKDFLNREK